MLVVGAGIAGAAIAAALARRGSQVTVLEASAHPAGRASGHPRAVVRPLLARDRHDPLATFYRSAFHCLLERLKSLDAASFHCLRGAHLEHQSPLELDPAGDRVELLDAERATRLLGVPAKRGLFLHDAMTLSPRALCLRLLSQPSIRLHTCARVMALERIDRRWFAIDPNGSTLASAPTAVIANGPALSELLPELCRVLHSTFGLATRVKVDPDARPAAALLAKQSLTPCGQGISLFGGHWRTQPHLHAAVDGLQADLPIRLQHTESATLSRRLHSPDRLPLVGPVPRMAETTDRFSALRHGAPPDKIAAYEPALYLLGALGGRGITSAIYAAEMLASAMQGEPLERLPSVHPLRFLVRALRRDQSI